MLPRRPAPSAGTCDGGGRALWSARALGSLLRAAHAPESEPHAIKHALASFAWACETWTP